MTLSYSVGLTTGSAVAYLLNSWLGPYSSADPCQQLNTTSAAISPSNNLTVTHALYDLLPSSFLPRWLTHWPNVWVDRRQYCLLSLSATVISRCISIKI